jgi:hypothetical protein
MPHRSPHSDRWAKLKGFMTTALQLENIRRRCGKVLALDGLSILVREGEVYGFLGRNLIEVSCSCHSNGQEFW